MSVSQDEKATSFSINDGAAQRSESSLVATVKDIAAPKRTTRHPYITGLRGILVVQSFIWLFFETFIPTLTSSKTPGPAYQDILRYVLSVPLWNASLIYNFFIVLSMRTICVSFLENPTGQTYAATIIRRTVRIVLAVGAASGISMMIFSQIGTQYINEFKTKLPNESISTPSVVQDGGAAIGALFTIFWLTGDWYTQAANTFWPSATLWVPSVIYYQVSLISGSDDEQDSDCTIVVHSILSDGYSSIHQATLAYIRIGPIRSWVLLDGILGLVFRRWPCVCRYRYQRDAQG